MFYWPSKPYQSAEIRNLSCAFREIVALIIIKTLAQCFLTNLYEAS